MRTMRKPLYAGKESKRPTRVAYADQATSMYETGEWSDLTIEAGGKEFKVHKSVVCSACPFVEAACTKGFRETHTNRIKLPERAVTVEAMLQHFYAVLWWNTTLFATKPTGADVMYAKDLIDLRTAADKARLYQLVARRMLMRNSMTLSRSPPSRIAGGQNSYLCSRSPISSLLSVAESLTPKVTSLRICELVL